MKRKVLLIILAILCVNIAKSQNQSDIVELTNGSLIKGEVIEQIPGKLIKVNVDNQIYQFDSFSVKNVYKSGSTSHINIANVRTETTAVPQKTNVNNSISQNLTTSREVNQNYVQPATERKSNVSSAPQPVSNNTVNSVNTQSNNFYANNSSAESQFYGQEPTQTADKVDNSYNPRRLNFKIELGYTSAWLSGYKDLYEGEGSTSMVNGAMASFGVTFAITPSIGVETGIGYLYGAGNEYSYSYENYSQEETNHIHYIMFPIHAKYDFLANLDNVKGSTAGVSLGLDYGKINYWGVTSKYSYNGESNTTTDDINLDLVNNLTAFHLGVFYSGGRWGSSANLSLGMNDIAEDLDVKSSFVSFSVYVRL